MTFPLIIGIDDLGDVLDAVESLASEWRRLSTKLGLKNSTLDVIEHNNPGDVDGCLHKALREWLRLNYSHQRHGRPSWERLAQAVSSLDGALAEKISVDSETMSGRADYPLQLGKPIKEGSVDYQELDKAMKEGSVDYQGIDSVLVGIGGAGKTHTLAMILNELLPDKRVSTPCTKPPVRTVTQVTIGEDSGVLKRVEGKEYLAIIADTVWDVAHSLPPTSQLPVIRKIPVEHFIRELEEQILYQENTEDVQLLYNFRWNRITDSGGQPQFLEILTIFLHHMSLGIFVIKLNERLDAFPMIEFYNHAGNLVGTPYKSRYSQEQVIRHFMRALISQGGQGMGVKFLFIGTHRDRMEESKDESIQDKNKRLNEIIKSFNMEKNVIYRAGEGRNPIFAINAETPDASDWNVMEEVRRNLVESANRIPPISIPIRLEVRCVCAGFHTGFSVWGGKSRGGGGEISIYEKEGCVMRKRGVVLLGRGNFCLGGGGGDPRFPTPLYETLQCVCVGGGGVDSEVAHGPFHVKSTRKMDAHHRNLHSTYLVIKPQ